MIGLDAQQFIKCFTAQVISYYPYDSYRVGDMAVNFISVELEETNIQNTEHQVNKLFATTRLQSLSDIRIRCHWRQGQEHSESPSH